MRVRSAHFTNFKRFTDLRIEGLPATARLVVITGPNGSGKSAIFEGFNWYRRNTGGWGQAHDLAYWPKALADGSQSASHNVSVEFHEGEPPDMTARRRLFWIRSAYRHEADFNTSQLNRQGPVLDDAGPARLIEVEQTVRKNYERLASLILQSVFDPSNDEKRIVDFRQEHIGRIQRTMRAVFGDLILRSPGDLLEDGTFFFDKGSSSRFHYKNLSAGEKAAFDLILDFHMRADAYNDTVFCIDEPELHLGSRVQALLLGQLFAEMSPQCQLWIATHSLGMMRQAVELHRQNPDEVFFIDTADVDFDGSTTLSPTNPGRDFWQRALEFALDDLAGLMAPSQIVLCEGRDPATGFDASVYRTVFAQEFPDTEFLSVGSSNEVKGDRAGIAGAIKVIAPGTQVYRLVDRDEHSDDEMALLRQGDIRVLGRRNIECYLLADDVLLRLCEEAGQPDRHPDLITCRDEAVQTAAAQRGRAADDLKSARGAVQVFAVQELGLRHSGSNADQFLRGHLAPLMTGTETYRELRRDVFESSRRHNRMRQSS